MMKTIMLLIALAVPSAALADGGFFAPWVHEIWEHEQVALLDWNAADATETLTVLPGFWGDMQEFAWVIPVPAEPEVRAGQRALFEDLFAVSRPLYRRRDEGWSCENSSMDTGVPPPSADGVEVLQRDLVGIFDITVLAADNAASLVDSLDVWGYLHDGNRDLAEPILADYVARAWIFVTLRVDSTAFAESVPDHDPGTPWYGGMEPIELSFPTPAPVYPMRISAVSTRSHALVTVFACSEERLTFPGARTRYANRFSDGELAAIAADWPDVAARLRPGRFLTRLERTMGAEDMTVDLVLSADAEQGEFLPIRYSGSVGYWWFLGSVLVAWSVARLHARWAQRRWDAGPR